jgi:hypothetical protein
VKLSEQSVEEMRAARDAQTAPYVVVYLDATDMIVRLVMENLGQTVARDINLHFSPVLDPGLGATQGHEWPRFMTDTTPVLAPRQRMSAILNSYPVLINNDKLKPEYSVIVSYHGGMTEESQSVLRSDTFVLDVRSFYGMEIIGTTDTEKAIEQLSALVESIKSLQTPLADIKKRFDTGLVVTQGSPFVAATQPEDNKSVATSLAAGLRMAWILIESKNRARERVPELDRVFVRRALEQLAILTPHIELPSEIRARIMAILADLDSLVGTHFKYGRDVEDRVMPLLNELVAQLSKEQSLSDEQSEQQEMEIEAPDDAISE